MINRHLPYIFLSFVCTYFKKVNRNINSLQFENEFQQDMKFNIFLKVETIIFIKICSFRILMNFYFYNKFLTEKIKFFSQYSIICHVS